MGLDGGSEVVVFFLVWKGSSLSKTSNNCARLIEIAFSKQSKSVVSAIKDNL